MPLSKQQKDDIKNLLLFQIRKKLKTYKPETTSMPFHTRLLGKDRMALFSFIHSFNTTLGTSIFEQVAKIIGQSHFPRIVSQYSIGNQISSSAQNTIQEIMNKLTTSELLPDKEKETNKVLKVAQEGEIIFVKPRRVDLFIQNNYGVEYYFDLKTAKPNIGDFEKYKRMLLEWIGIRGRQAKNISIHTCLAIPYNPYEPKPYKRWTLQGLFDVENEILVADEFWDFLGGSGTYQDTLDVFEEAGLELKSEIEDRFSDFRS